MAKPPADPVIPLKDACKFTALTPEALQALRIAIDEQQQSYKLSALVEVLKARTVAQQQAARAHAAANARKGWFSELLRARR